MILFEYRGRRPAPAAGLSAAERRKAEWTARRERLWMSAVYASSFLFIVLVTAQFIYAKSVTALSPPVKVAVVNGEVRIALSEVIADDLNRFSADIQGHPVRFFLMRKTDGKIVALFDACQICGPEGYYRSGNRVICKNCGAPMNVQSLGQTGGCNPVPLKSSENGSEVVITAADLAGGTSLFTPKQH
jgi:uncharacterized membrane protein